MKWGPVKRAAHIFVLCLMAAAAGCRADGGGSPAIAKVNNQDVSRAEFDRFLALKLGEFNSPETPDSIRSQMLDEYIRRRVVLDEAARAGLTVTDAEVEQAARENPQMRSKAASAGSREEVARDLLAQKYYRQVVLRDFRVSNDEIQQYVDENSSRLADRLGYYVREIRVQSRDQAEALRREVTEGRRDFASLARLHSDAPNAGQGGLARYDEGQLPDVLERAVRPLRPGEVSAVTESNFGYHIFKLERRVEPRPPDDRRPTTDDRRAALIEEFVARKNQEAVDAAVERLMSAARVQINGPALGFAYRGQLKRD
jgi:parvulin-like peptidyl-prolyl isomerase